MDGNGRWASNKGLPRIQGHKKGIEAVEEITIACRELNIPYLTLYAFSDENWERPLEEVKALMDLLVEFLQIKRKKLIDNRVRFVSIGDKLRLPDYVQGAISETEKATSAMDGLVLNVALSYGSRSEICRAVNKIISSGEKEVSPESFSKFMDTTGTPDPDLLIRTSGEKRISNFLLWQIAYTELYFTDVMWPEFTKEELKKAVGDYCKRERRFGKTSEQLC